jgi:hypothetical protein
VIAALLMDANSMARPFVAVVVAGLFLQSAWSMMRDETENPSAAS